MATKQQIILNTRNRTLYKICYKSTHYLHFLIDFYEELEELSQSPVKKERSS